MRSSSVACAIGLMSIIGSATASASEAGVYDGTYDLAFGETYVVVSCAFSNFAGEFTRETPRLVTIPEGSEFPEEVIAELAALTDEHIQELGLDRFSARLAEEFADTFYDKLQREIDVELETYPDQMTVVMSDPLEELPYMYLFDAGLVDEATGWSVETEGLMRTNVGAFGIEPVVAYDYDLAFDTTVLGLLVTREMGGIVDEEQGIFRWATRVVAVNQITELILGCSASGVAPFGLWLSATDEPDVAATPIPEPSGDDAARASRAVRHEPGPARELRGSGIGMVSNVGIIPNDLLPEGAEPAVRTLEAALDRD